MLAAPLTADEDRRIRLLELLGLLDSPAEEAFDRVTRLAAQLLGVPTSLVTLVDRERQWFKSRVGFDRAETPREQSFCAHALHEDEVLVVPDARLDPRFAGNPLVNGAPHIRFYAGVPLRSTGGVALGTLCVIDREPRTPSALQLQQLADLAAIVRREVLHRETAVQAAQVAGENLLIAAEADAMFRATFEQAAVGIALVALDGRWIRFNARLAEIVGHPEAELAALSLRDITHPDDLAADLAQTRRLLAGEVEQFRLEKRYVRRDGSVLWAGLSVALVRRADGRPQYLIAIVQDIDARKRAVAGLRESEERFRALSASSPVGIFQSDLEGRLTYANPRAQEIWAASEEEIRGYGWTARVHPDDLPGLLSRWRRDLAEGRECEAEYRLRLDDGTVRHVQGCAAPLHGAGGRMIGSVGTVMDITERRQMKLALEESERSLRLALGAGRMSAWDVSLRSEREAAPAGQQPEPRPAEGAAYRIASLPGSALETPDSWAALLAAVHPEDRARVAAAGARSCAGQEDLDEEFRVLQPGSGERWLQVRGRMVRGSDGRAQRLVGVSLDITERKELEAELTRQAYHDALTGLANRARFREHVARALAATARAPGAAAPAGQAAVLFVDLDDFKTVNDSLGHAVGDRLLILVAARLIDATRGDCTVARLGGDEFAVLVEAPRGADAAVRIADRIVAALAVPFPLERRTIRVGASVGIALARPGDGTDELLRNADLAMYRAKNGGKGRYELFAPEMHAAVLDRLTLEDDLHRALEAGEFVLHYQPIVELATGRVAGAEALVRWRHPVRGLIPPNVFIPIAEQTGLILPLGRWALAEACREAGQWRRGEAGTGDAAEAPIAISVNVSARQMQDPFFVGDVRDALCASELAPGRLILEITESVLMRDREATLERMRALKALGVRFAVDDFGTGFSSLAYLQHFPIDVLKIDKAFVDTVAAGGPTEGALVRSIIGLADALGMRTVAEGVEQPLQCTELQVLGCRFAQGYLFARPMSTEALRAVLLAPPALLRRGEPGAAPGRPQLVQP